MALNKNFLPIFDISSNLADGLRTIKTAEALATGWYKGQIDYHLRKAGLITWINGQEYYVPAYGTLYYSANFFNKGTAGWHVAEFFKLVGMSEDDLKQIWYTAYSGNVDGIYHLWRAKNALSPINFRRFMNDLSDKIDLVDAIEIDYENQKYKKSIYITEVSRPYNTKESIYGDSLQWGQKQGAYGIERIASEQRIFELNGIINNSVEYCFGKSIRLYSLGVDITSSFEDNVLYALQSMIAYSGNEFMQRTSSVKKSEVEIELQQYTIDDSIIKGIYVSVTGTETFTGTIKNTFIDDEESRHFKRYTGIPVIDENGTINELTESINELQGRMPLDLTEIKDNEIKVFYASQMWKIYTIGTDIFSPNVNKGDEFLFYDLIDPNLGAYMNVKAFRKLSLDEIGEYFSIYFDIRTTSPKGTWFEGFIGFLANMLGKIFDLAFKELMLHPEMKLTAQLFTKFGNHILSKELTEKEYGRQVAGLAIAILGTVFSWGTMWQLALAVGMALATAGSEAIEKEKEAKSEQEANDARDKQRKEDDKKQKEKEEMRERMNASSEESEDDEFQRFLKNPLYKIDDEKKQLKSSFESQFKLI